MIGTIPHATKWQNSLVTKGSQAFLQMSPLPFPLQNHSTGMEEEQGTESPPCHPSSAAWVALCFQPVTRLTSASAACQMPAIPNTSSCKSTFSTYTLSFCFQEIVWIQQNSMVQRKETLPGSAPSTSCLCAFSELPQDLPASSDCDGWRLVIHKFLLLGKLGGDHTQFIHIFIHHTFIKYLCNTGFWHLDRQHRMKKQFFMIKIWMWMNSYDNIGLMLG